MIASEDNSAHSITQHPWYLNFGFQTSSPSTYGFIDWLNHNWWIHHFINAWIHQLMDPSIDGVINWWIHQWCIHQLIDPSIIDGLLGLKPKSWDFGGAVQRNVLSCSFFSFRGSYIEREEIERYLYMYMYIYIVCIYENLPICAIHSYLYIHARMCVCIIYIYIYIYVYIYIYICTCAW